MWKNVIANRLAISNGFLRTGAYYSKDSKARELLEKLFAPLGEEVSFERNPHKEGGPNWEIFNPKGNRFFMPHSTGLAWQVPRTVQMMVKLENLVDFDSKAPDKFHVSIHPCPALIKMQVKDLFPKARTIITLTYQQDTDVEYGARNFLLAATEICRRLHFEGYNCDFCNPFSGNPFFASHRQVTEINKEVDHGFRYEKIDDCTVMSHVGKQFSGIIFTNAPLAPAKLKKLIEVDLLIKAFLLRNKFSLGEIDFSSDEDDYNSSDDSDGY